MDANFIRSAITLISLVAFLGIVWWAWTRGRKGLFDEAANLPFADDEMQRRTLEKEREGEPPGNGEKNEEGQGRG